MKYTHYCLLSLSVCLSSAAYADAAFEDSSTMVSLHPVEEDHPHHLYFGPEFLAYQLNIDVGGVEVAGTRYFEGSRIGYDYIKPNFVYAGVDLMTATTLVDFTATQPGHSLSWHRANRDFGNLEVRLGYTFSDMDWIMATFLGAGVYNVFAEDHHNHQGFTEDLPYVTGGFHYKYAFGPTFHLALDFKAFRTIGANQTFKDDTGSKTRHHNMWGGEMALPFSWNLGTEKRWDIQLVPYFLKLDFFEKQNLYGLRLLFGYHF